jgi:hypothetical protein
MRTRTTLDPAASGEQAVAVVERDGGVIIRGPFDRELVAEPRSEIDSVLRGQDDFSEGAQVANPYQQFGAV